ncbi:MAG TPA: glycosyltransferase family 4 protein [Gemmatimonadaceae bacterium]|nr:glycosyltransferase family 4 protein [Gemmatimonadaceae bacterium]
MTTTADARDTILIIGNYPPPYGGVPRHLEELTPTLVAAGWNVLVLSPGIGTSFQRPYLTVIRESRGFVRRRCSPLQLLLRARRFGYMQAVLGFRRMMPSRAWWRAMTRFALIEPTLRSQRIRLVAAYNVLFGAPVGAMVSETLGVPLVVSNFGEAYSHRALMEAHRPFLEYLTQTATLTSLSRHCAQSYRLFGLSPSVEVIPYGTHIERFAAAARGPSPRSRLRLNPESRVVLFLGRLAPDMGLETVLDAAPNILASSPEACVLIAGATGPLRTTVERAAAQTRNRLRLAVDVPERDLPAYLAASDVVMVPTLGPRACGSLAALEAMATARPVVAARVGGIPEIVVDGETGILVPPGDPQALEAAVVRLLTDPATARTMGRRGAERVKTHFDISRTNSAIERLFRRVATTQHLGTVPRDHT